MDQGWASLKTMQYICNNYFCFGATENTEADTKSEEFKDYYF